MKRSLISGVVLSLLMLSACGGDKSAPGSSVSSSTDTYTSHMNEQTVSEDEKMATLSAVAELSDKQTPNTTQEPTLTEKVKVSLEDQTTQKDKMTSSDTLFDPDTGEIALPEPSIETDGSEINDAEPDDNPNTKPSEQKSSESIPPKRTEYTGNLLGEPDEF